MNFSSLPPAPEQLFRRGVWFFWMLLVVLLAFVVWAAWARIDIVIAAQAQVEPRGFVQSIQHLEGGIVAQIAVQEGDSVDQGQPLIILQGTASSANLAELESSIGGLSLAELRLRAELDRRSGLEFPDDLNLTNEQRQALVQRFSSRMQALRAALDVADEEEEQARLDLVRARTMLESLEGQRELLSEQVEISRRLRSENLSNRFEQLALLRELARIDGQIADQRAAIEGSQQAVALAEVKRTQIETNFDDAASSQLEDALQSLEQLRERRRKLLDSVQRNVLLAPKSGIVRTLYVKTVGGVIAPGETVLDLVPQEGGVVVQVRVNPRDIGPLRVGMPARMTLTSSDASRFGSITGSVVLISPDTVRDQPNEPSYYQVQVHADAVAFTAVDATYPLVPGVELLAAIVVGRRSVLDYLISPFVQGMEVALQER